MKKFKIIPIILIIFILTAAAAYYAWSSNLFGSQLKEIESDETSADFELTMLDVGQGLSVLIKCDDKYMLYDGGGRTTSSYVVSYLKQRGIDSLDYIVASHYDEDHISGLIGVLNTTSVDTAIMPDYVNDTATYLSFQDKLAQSSADVVHPSVGDTFSLGSAKVTVLGPKTYDCDSDNDKSIAVRVSYGSFGAIITGDAEALEESDIVSSGEKLRSDIYVVGHHGSSSSSSEEFLKKVKPSYAFISAGEGNDYGHPHTETLERLDNIGAKIYRTDRDGEVTAYVSGKKLWLRTVDGNKSSDTTSDASNNASDTSSSASGGTTYVLNNNTHKFHYPDCKSVADIAEYNREDTDLSREKLIEIGYEPCGNCKP